MNNSPNSGKKVATKIKKKCKVNIMKDIFVFEIFIYLKDMFIFVYTG